MDRNDVKCQECGRYIFNGFNYWCVKYSGECITATSDTTNLHVFTQGTRREEFNGYQLCPTCMDKYENRCPVCDKLLTVKRAWKRGIPITINDKLITVNFVMVSKEGDSSTKFNIVIGEHETNQVINFDDSDKTVINNINDAVLATFGVREWDFY